METLTRVSVGLFSAAAIPFAAPAAVVVVVFYSDVRCYDCACADYMYIWKCIPLHLPRRSNIPDVGNIPEIILGVLNRI